MTTTTTEEQTEEQIPGQTTVEDQLAESEQEAKQEAKRKRQAQQNKAYSDAQTRLRDAHRDEFETFVAEEYEKVGLTFRRRATKAEKEARDRELKTARARAKLEKLLAENPELRSQVKG